MFGAERLSTAQRLAKYRQFVYEVGEIKTDKGKSVDPKIVAKEAVNQFTPTMTNRFLGRTRHFTDSGIIGSREFVRNLWLALKLEDDNPVKQPVRISGLEGMFSLRRLSEK